MGKNYTRNLEDELREAHRHGRWASVRSLTRQLLNKQNRTTRAPAKAAPAPAKKSAAVAKTVAAAKKTAPAKKAVPNAAAKRAAARKTPAKRPAKKS